MQQVQHRTGRRETGSAREAEVGLAPKLERIVCAPRWSGSASGSREHSVTDDK